MNDYDEIDDQLTDVFRVPGLNYNPGILVAYAPHGDISCDRLAVGEVVTVGRQRDCNLSVDDSTLSREHFRIFSSGTGQTIEDLGSKNGTYLNGQRLGLAEELKNRAVIRAGEMVFVFYENAGPYLGLEQTKNNYGLAGRFHASHVLRELAECSQSDPNLLLHGPTGSGKGVAAHALARMLDKPITIQDATGFASDEEALCALFGVGHKVFPGVDATIGDIDVADKGILFIDNIHMLSEQVQKSLLKVMEEKKLSRFGETNTKTVDVVFLLASNEAEPYLNIESDLFAALRTISMQPLYRCPADVPSIFDHLLTVALEEKGEDPAPVIKALLSNHYESLMLDGFRDHNVRGLLDLADQLVSRITLGVEPKQAILEVFSDRYANRYPSKQRARKRKIRRETTEITQQGNLSPAKYEKVTEAYYKHAGNVTAMEKDLRRQGIHSTRHTISKILDMLKLPRVTKPRKS